MKRSQSGFTLIELVVVIVLLGILGVTALGKFQDLSGNAEDAAIEAVAAEITASSAINYASSMLNNGGTVTINHTTSNNASRACGDAVIASLMASGTVPGGAGHYTYTFGSSTATTNTACDAAGDTYTCILSRTGATKTPTASIICTGG